MTTTQHTNCLNTSQRRANILNCIALIIRERKLIVAFVIKFVCCDILCVYTLLSTCTHYMCMDMQADTKAAFDVLKAHNLLKQKVRSLAIQPRHTPHTHPTHTHTHTHTHAHAHTHTYIHAHAHTCTYTYTHIQHTRTLTYMHTYIQYRTHNPHMHMHSCSIHGDMKMKLKRHKTLISHCKSILKLVWYL